MQHPDTARVWVTTVDENGASSCYERKVDAVIEHDADKNPLFKGSLLWGTTDDIPTVGRDQNPEPVTEPFFPGPAGVRFVFFTFLPQSEGSGDVDRYVVEGSEGPGESEMPGLAESFDAKRPGMHITDTIDFVHVLSGEMVMILDGGETLVKKGDVIVMRGGWHAWRNESTEPCTVASVLVGAHRHGER